MPTEKTITILTGAGISAESGLKTFRDHNGLWENHRVEEVASPEGFGVNPKLVYKFYNDRRVQLLSDEVKPNQAHISLGDLQNNFKGNVHIITQNVDDLHERGGAKNVFHMHGELLKMRCQKTHEVFKSLETFDGSTPCPCCSIPGNLRPHIVWFGEVPLHMDEIHDLLFDCHTFVSIGTSGSVYPAAGFVQMAKLSGARTLELNFGKTENHQFFDESREGKATILVPEWVEEVLSE